MKKMTDTTGLEYIFESDDLEDDPWTFARNNDVIVLSNFDFSGGYTNDSGKLVAALFTAISPDSYEFDIVVDPGYRRRGLADDLMDTAIRQYNDYTETYPDMVFWLDAINPISVHMLEKRGFRVVQDLGDRKIMTRNPEEPYVYDFVPDEEETPHHYQSRTQSTEEHYLQLALCFEVGRQAININNLGPEDLAWGDGDWYEDGIEHMLALVEYLQDKPLVIPELTGHFYDYGVFSVPEATLVAAVEYAKEIGSDNEEYVSFGPMSGLVEKTKRLTLDLSYIRDGLVTFGELAVVLPQRLGTAINQDAMWVRLERLVEAYTYHTPGDPAGWAYRQSKPLLAYLHQGDRLEEQVLNPVLRSGLIHFVKKIIEAQGVQIKQGSRVGEHVIFTATAEQVFRILHAR